MNLYEVGNEEGIIYGTIIWKDEWEIPWSEAKSLKIDPGWCDFDAKWCWCQTKTMPSPFQFAKEISNKAYYWDWTLSLRMTWYQTNVNWDGEKIKFSVGCKI